MALSVGSSVTGMNAATVRQGVAAHNVANVNTPGFAQYTVNQTDMAPEGTRIASLSRTTNTDPTRSNVDLAETSKEQIISKGSLAANATVFKAKDKMMGEVIDLIA